MPRNINGNTVNESICIPAALPQVVTLPPFLICFNISTSGVPPTVSIACAYNGFNNGRLFDTNTSRPYDIEHNK